MSADSQFDARVLAALRASGPSYCYDLCKHLGGRRYLDVWESLKRLEHRRQVRGEDDGSNRKRWCIAESTT